MTKAFEKLQKISRDATFNSAMKKLKLALFRAENNSLARSSVKLADLKFMVKYFTKYKELADKPRDENL